MNDRFKPFYNSTGICTDTRTISKDCLFICIQGENFDGNTFSEQALQNGASHVIVDNPDYYSDKNRMTLVDNSVQYLQNLANHHRRKFNIPVIGITGSNGKTTSKELIHQVLSKKYKVLATKGNLNNHLGVPFTLLRMTEEHEIAIIEMGANRFKDIEELCNIAEPTHGIITNIGKAHLEGFGNFEGVLKTKKELYEAVFNNRGTIILNQDDDTLRNNTPENVKLFSYGTKPNSEVQGELISLTPFVQMKWSHSLYSSPLLNTQMIGKYNFYNYLAACAFGVHFNVQNDKISEAIEEYTPTNNRSQVKKSETNTLILDCYNANPSSVSSALESFAMNQSSKKLFILGDMKELGDDSALEHQKAIHQAEKLNLEGYVVGKEFSSITSKAILERFENVDQAKAFIQNNGVRDHLILLKGSRSMKLEILEDSL